jgi:ornithine cyclodeaminase
MSSSTSNLTILTARDVDKVLSLPATVDKAMETQAEVFRTFSALPVTSSDHPTDVQMPDRIATATEGHTILYMPSRIKTAGGTGIKIVSVPTRGGEDGLPASTLLIDDSTGKVSGIINARQLTALRNACGQCSCRGFLLS